MKLSNKAKKNFEEDNEFYIKLGKKLRQARRTKVNEFTGKETIVPLTKVAKALTPVPGGVGPMTIACLLKNTVDCFKRSQK